jgi:hypothetical protein
MNRGKSRPLPFLPAPGCRSVHLAGSGCGGQGCGPCKYPKMSTAPKLSGGRMPGKQKFTGEHGIPLYIVPEHGGEPDRRWCKDTRITGSHVSPLTVFSSGDLQQEEVFKKTPAASSVQTDASRRPEGSGENQMICRRTRLRSSPVSGLKTLNILQRRCIVRTEPLAAGCLPPADRAALCAPAK